MGHFDTGKVVCMKLMFSDCCNITWLNLGNFETKQIWDWKMDGMFWDCDNLEYLDISGFDKRAD